MFLLKAPEHVLACECERVHERERLVEKKKFLSVSPTGD